MTREEAITNIGMFIQDATERGASSHADRTKATDALATLAPPVRFDRPTVEEFVDSEKLWVFIGSVWLQMPAQEFRNLLSHSYGRGIPWLPPTAIPVGGA